MLAEQNEFGFPEIFRQLRLEIFEDIQRDRFCLPRVEEHADQLGGSASYAAVGASNFFARQLLAWWVRIFPNRNLNSGNPATSTRGACSSSGQNFSLVGRIRLGLEHAGNTIGGAERLRKFSAQIAGKFSRDRIRFLANIAPPCNRLCSIRCGGRVLSSRIRWTSGSTSRAAISRRFCRGSTC